MFVSPGSQHVESCPKFSEGDLEIRVVVCFHALDGANRGGRLGAVEAKLSKFKPISEQESKAAL